MDRLDRSLGISAVNHYHERAQQDCCFAEIKGENEHRACQGIADKAVQPLCQRRTLSAFEVTEGSAGRAHPCAVPYLLLKQSKLGTSD